MNETTGPGDKRLWSRGAPTLLFLLAGYVALRALAWANTYLLDDHDSILYVQQIEAFRTFDAATIQALSPDVTPFYPFFGAMLSLPGWSTEFAARLCSLMFSVGLFFSVWHLSRQVCERPAAILGLATLAISPFLIVFSIGILSEPAYVAVVYAGFAYFLWQHKSPTLLHAAVLGIVFGMGFLNRLEGLLFLVAIPVFQAIAYWHQTGSVRTALAPALRWTIIYTVTFAVIVAPQLISVSDKMNRFALNGRTVWAELQLSPDAGTYEEEIYGLDYSPAEINLTYLQREPVQLAKTGLGSRVASMAETIVRNIDKLYAMQVGKLGGSLLVAFALIGLLSIYSMGRRLETLLLAGFLVATLVPGIITDPKPRAVAAAVPLLALLAGPGMIFLAAELRRDIGLRWLRPLVLPAIILILLTVWIVPLLGIYLSPKKANEEYSLASLAPLQDIVESVARQDADKPLTITARKQYLPYFTRSRFVPLPFTSYDGLIKYCRANRVDLLFLQHRLTHEYPFMQEIIDSGGTQELDLLYESEDAGGDPIVLYRLRYDRS